ncbi:MAG TPA: hypothetical protein P5544_15240 [Candidatus Nanopelagicales bacterium]|nr:hypothetical protein [Candidatus Nanopelagicales bacterium]
MSDSFDLTALVRRAAADNTEEPSPRRIAEIVWGNIPPDQHGQLLQRLLPSFVADTLRRVENVPASSPRVEWADTLGERVPTPDGYRFLRDCTADDVRAGAQRRRSNAEALTRRAELYEAIASRMDDGLEHTPVAGVTPTPASLDVKAGVEIIINHRGYRWPWPDSLDELPAERRPSISEILDELSWVPPRILVSELERRPDILDKVAVASARGWTEALDPVLESTELVELYYQALQRVYSNLQASAAHRKVRGDERGRRDLGDDIRHLAQRIGAVRRLLQRQLRAVHNPSTLRSAAEKEWRTWARELRSAHKETYERELLRRLRQAGVPLEATPFPARADLYRFVVDRGLVAPDQEAEKINAYNDEAFDRLVREDISRKADDQESAALRHPLNRERWMTTLKSVSEEHLGRVPADDVGRVRASRFHQALMQRQGEARRVGADMVTIVRAHIDELDHVGDRRRISDETTLWLADLVGSASPVEYQPSWISQ